MCIPCLWLVSLLLLINVHPLFVVSESIIANQCASFRGSKNCGFGLNTNSTTILPLENFALNGWYIEQTRIPGSAEPTVSLLNNFSR